MSNAHLDTNILLNKKTRKRVLTLRTVRDRQLKVVVSPFTLAEIFTQLQGNNHEEAEEALNDIINATQRGHLEVFIFNTETWNTFQQYMQELAKEAQRLGLTDMLIVATALSDPQALYLVTRDREIASSKTIHDIIEKKQLKIEIREEL